MKAMPRVSVIIPCYNQGHYLSDAIESVRSQGYEHTETIVVDDGSTDQTADVVRRYSEVSYIRQSNRGLAGARNRGLEASTGEFVVFLDADDRLVAGHFTISLDRFAERPDLSLVFGDYRLIGTTAGHEHECTPRPDYLGAFLRHNIIPCPATAMVRRSVAMTLGGFHTDVPGVEDYDFYLRVAASHAMVCHHHVVAEYRQHPAQMSKQADLMLAGCVTVLRRQRPHLRRHPEYPAALRYGLRAARERYGEQALWKMTNALRSGHIGEAGAILRTLVICYPQGLVRHIAKKLKRMANGHESSQPA